jgi:Lamin Tail Domain/Chitobiase/beta-hexosaminidase C-terminal domain/CotH kinase protein
MSAFLRCAAGALTFCLLLQPASGATVTTISPTPGNAVGSLSLLSITFSEDVAGVDTDDLFINGATPQAVSGTGAGPYTFTFTQPPPGGVSIEFAGDTGIAPVSGVGDFQPPESWSYTLNDILAPSITLLAPAAGSTVGTLTRALVTFSETVTGIDAGDLTINGTPASAVSGFGAGPYVFTFATPSPGGAVNFVWTAGHGIADLAGNAFAGPGWSLTRDAAGSGSLVINEFVAVNASTFLDEDLDNEAWIEILNTGATPVDLTGWALTDDVDVPGKWIFPSRQIASGEYLVVFASEKDRRPVSGDLHTNFKIGVNGGYLALVRPDQPVAPATVFASFAAQRAGYSYGLSSGQVRYFTPSTPGAVNSATTLSAVAVTPVPGTTRGFFTTSFPLTLTTTTPGATIRYTTDGSEPTASTGTLYSVPITISGTTALRAAAFATGLVPSATATFSYIFLDQVIDQSNTPAGFPTTWGSNSAFPGGAVLADYGMDRDPLRVAPTDSASAVDPVKLQRLKDGLRELPSLSIVIPNSSMFASTGMYHSSHVKNKNFPDKLCSIEMILPNGTTAFATTVGLGVHGNASREPQKNPKHGFGLKFKPEFGPSKLEYRLFPETAGEEYDDLILRAEYGTSWRHPSDVAGDGLGSFQRSRSSGIRDMWMKDTMLEMGGVASHSRLVHVFINGLYFGVYDLSEDASADFGESFLGGQKEDYDVLDQGVLKDGTPEVYNTMLALPAATANSTYEQFKTCLEMPMFIDYMLLHFYAGHQDWGLNKNWSALRQHAGGTFSTEGKFIYVPWDGENVLLDTTINRVPNAGGSSDVPSGLHTRLDDNAQYRLDFADRVHRSLIAPGGALTIPRNTARWQKWQALLDKPIVAESCRWGDYRRDVHPYSLGTFALYTREDQWLAENSRVVNIYFPTRVTVVMQQLRDAGLYPTLNAPEFRNGPGGALIGSGQVTPGLALAMALPVAESGTTSAGTIYYTTDGTDPRVIYSGAVSSNAQTYSGVTIPINGATTVKARILNGGTWSALNEAAFTTDSALPAIRITELMYNPSAGAELEFVEIFNAGAQTVDLNGWYFTGINYVFPPGSTIAPGSRLVIAINDDPASWRAKYPGVSPFAWFGGSLSNSGETVALLNAAGLTISTVTYQDKAPWPTSPDGSGYSLELVDTNASTTDPNNWQASGGLGGTPGTPNSLPAPPSITTHPSDRTVAQGAGTTLATAATGKALYYQWKLGNDIIPGATSPSYALPAVVSANDGIYRCVVSNPGGFDTTNPAKLIVTQTFAQWIADTLLGGADAAADGDPDADGIVNIVEFYHHLDPESPAIAADRVTLPTVETPISGSNTLSVVYRTNQRARPGRADFYSTTSLSEPWILVTPTIVETLSSDPVTGDPRVRATFPVTPGATKAFLKMELQP